MTKKEKSEQAAKEQVAEAEIVKEAVEGAEAQPDEGSCEQELQSAQQEIAELKDKVLRTHAEMENLRKRTRREVEDAHKFGVEKFATALLDVVDNLERALEAEAGSEAALREGVQLTLNSWHEMMKRFHLERIDAVGDKFDPHRHEALSKMPSDEEENTVIAQHVAGYTLHGRLIRPAKVLVSSGPAET